MISDSAGDTCVRKICAIDICEVLVRQSTGSFELA